MATSLYFLPLEMRIPLKFGAETLTHITCARAGITVADAQGRIAQGWGETPLSVQWIWPSTLSYQERHRVIEEFCLMLAEAWAGYSYTGHPIEIGYKFQSKALPELLSKLNQQRGANVENMPWLAALVCCSPFDIALHDAYGKLHDVGIYNTYGPEFMNRSLDDFLIPAQDSSVTFKNRYPRDYLAAQPADHLLAWHLVGGLDPLEQSDLIGKEPNDGYPILLTDWIQRDGLQCLKVKLRGNDYEWDYKRLVKVGAIAMQHQVRWLSTDYNCMVTDPAYVNDMLDELDREHPRIHDMILYVEQPFPYDLDENRIDVHSVSTRKPLFMDESAHDWQLIKLGRELGWTGVALKTCKTQTQAILSACWAKAHGMSLMVQDLSNPMLAMIPHVQLAAHVDTIAGVETNAMQFYPDVSGPEERVHPGLYKRRNGQVDLSTICGSGFGYRLTEIDRQLPAAAVRFGESG